MTDLYKVLGVKRTATAAQIKKAFRKLATKYHPDQNPGDDSVIEKYHAVVLAYEVLSDPDRRAEYDRSGDTRKAQPVSNELMGVIAPAVLRVLQECHASPNSDPTKIDIVARATVIIKDQLRSIERQLADFERAHKILEKVVGRFSVDDGENLLDQLVRSQLAGATADLDRVKAEADRVTRTLQYLKRCKYRTDGKPDKKDPGLMVDLSQLLGGWSTAGWKT